MKYSIVRVERNSFKGKDGNDVSYSKITFLVPVETTENLTGYDIESYTTKKENYNILVEIFKKNKPVDVDFDLVKVDNQGRYKKKIKRIDEIDL